MKILFKYILIFAFCVLLVVLGSKFKYILGGDIEAFFLYPQAFFTKAWYSWSDSNGTGAYTFVNQGALILYGLFFLMSKFINIKILNWSIYILSLFFSLLSVEKLSKYILKITDNHENWNVPFLVSVLYVFNIYFFFLFFRAIHTEVLAYFLIPFNLLCFLKYIHEDKKIYLLGSLSSLILAQNFGHLLVFAIAVLIITFWYIFIVTKNKESKVLAKSFKYVALMFLIHMIWFLPTVFYYLDQAKSIQNNNYVMETTVNVSFDEQLKNNTYYNSLRGVYGSLVGAKGFFPLPQFNSFLSLLLFLPFLLILSFLVFMKREGKSRKDIFYWLSILFFLLIFNLGAYGYFSHTYTSLVKKIPVMMVFRAVDSKVNYLILICFIFIFTLIFYELFKNKSHLKGKFLHLVLLSLIILPVSGFILKPFHQKYSTVEIPNEYIKSIQEFNEISKELGLKRGIILPKTGYQWASFTDWGFWGYSFFQQSNPNIGYFDIGNTVFSKEDYSFYVDNIESQKIKNINIEELTSRGVEFIIFQKDFNYNFTDYYTFKNSKKEYDLFLENNENKLLMVYDNLFFSVHAIRPIFYISNYFNEVQIYSKVQYGVLLASNEKLVVFDKYFHSKWIIYPAKEFSWWKAPFLKPIADKNHYMEYGYANAWNIQKPDLDRARDVDGQIKLVLYFLPQTYFYYGLIISLATFFSLIIYLAQDYLKNYFKKRKFKVKDKK